MQTTKSIIKTNVITDTEGKEYLPTQHFGWVRLTPKKSESKNSKELAKFNEKLIRIKNKIK